MNTKGGAIVNFIMILLITALIFLGVMYLRKGEIPFGISGRQAPAKEVVEDVVEPTAEEEMEDLAEAIDEESFDSVQDDKTEEELVDEEEVAAETPEASDEEIEKVPEEG